MERAPMSCSNPCLILLLILKLFYIYRKVAKIIQSSHILLAIQLFLIQHVALTIIKWRLIKNNIGVTKIDKISDFISLVFPLICFSWSRILHCIWFSCLCSLFHLWQFHSFSLALMTLIFLKSSYQLFGPMTLDEICRVFLIRLNLYMKLRCLITNQNSLHYMIISLCSYYISICNR